MISSCFFFFFLFFSEIKKKKKKIFTSTVYPLFQGIYCLLRLLLYTVHIWEYLVWSIYFWRRKSSSIREICQYHGSLCSFSLITLFFILLYYALFCCGGCLLLFITCFLFVHNLFTNFLVSISSYIHSVPIPNNTFISSEKCWILELEGWNS